MFLQSWWSNRYNRPLKDPILQSYTFEELLYEYHDYSVREELRQLNIEKQADIIEEEKEKAALDWAEEEERKELEALRAAEQAEAEKKATEPSEEDKEWMRKQMEEQLRINKELYGDDFGEDLSINFDE